jgi:uncharacterized membrane protein YfcA
MPELFTLAIALSGVFLIAFMKGAFGGGFAIVGIPLLSLAMDPIAAGALLAPLFVVMDVTALRYWRPNTWSRVDLAMLLPRSSSASGSVTSHCAIWTGMPSKSSWAR